MRGFSYERKPGESVEELRAMPYGEYLETDYWKAKRHYAKNAAGWRCLICNASADLVVHHRTYERIGDEHLKDLVVLCRECHALFHEGGRMPVPPGQPAMLQDAGGIIRGKDSHSEGSGRAGV